MQNQRRQDVEVVIPVNGPSRATSGTQNGKLRPLSVQEALQYSPFTTSTAAGHGRRPSRSYLAGSETDSLSPDRIPMPQISQATSSPNLTTSAERKSVRRSLEEISRNPTKHQPGPKSLQDVRHNVDMLLDGEALSELYVMSRTRGLEPTDLTFALHSSQYIQDTPFQSPTCALYYVSFGYIRPGA